MKREKLSIILIINKLKRVKKKLLFYEFSYEFAIRMLINIKFQTTILPLKTKAGQTVPLMAS